MFTGQPCFQAGYGQTELRQGFIAIVGFGVVVVYRFTTAGSNIPRGFRNGSNNTIGLLAVIVARQFGQAVRVYRLNGFCS